MPAWDEPRPLEDNVQLQLDQLVAHQENGWQLLARLERRGWFIFVTRAMGYQDEHGAVQEGGVLLVGEKAEYPSTRVAKAGPCVAAVARDFYEEALTYGHTGREH